MTEFIDDKNICIGDILSSEEKKDVLNKLSYYKKKNLHILKIAQQACSKKINDNQEQYNTDLNNTKRFFYIIISILFIIIVGLIVYISMKH